MNQTTITINGKPLTVNAVLTTAGTILNAAFAFGILDADPYPAADYYGGKYASTCLCVNRPDNSVCVFEWGDTVNLADTRHDARTFTTIPRYAGQGREE